MKLLLTSGGIQNDSQRRALIDLLGKPIAKAHALCIPTAVYGMKEGPYHAYSFITGTGSTPMCELGFQSVGVLELTALPSLDESLWVPLIEQADVLLVNGGDPLFLNYWMKKSGLAERLPSLKAVYVGLSAGSMVLTPRIGQAFVEWTPPDTTSDETLGLVEFSIFPHLDHELLPENTLDEAVKWAADLTGPSYAIDDQTAIQVVDGVVEVISEGHWKRFD
ncbi:peptidase E [Exiguobacterium sp. RIT594]|uniref:Type 1 glutamine amidotransferase-like domain-containing protein n=1 Tax=Exiguobacterium sp. RIT594 TaxID=2282449 RepID=UPI000DF75DCE|nr:peptidase E [Exiguobacterium sp. RIT594]RDB34250.1 peptidase E [Exiguobacterium sp. RIT594]